MAEEPGVHLVPHLDSAQVAGLRMAAWRTTDDGVLEAVAEYRPGDSRRDLRRRAWELIGAIAEPAASVRERADGDTVIFDVVTGIPENGHFATHGHTLRLTLSPASTTDQAG